MMSASCKRTVRSIHMTCTVQRSQVHVLYDSMNVYVTGLVSRNFCHTPTCNRVYAAARPGGNGCVNSERNGTGAAATAGNYPAVAVSLYGRALSLAIKSGTLCRTSAGESERALH